MPESQKPEQASIPSPTRTAVLPTPTSTETLTATPVPSGLCDNPLMSLDVGNRWVYQSTSELGTAEQVLRVMEWDEKVGLNAVIEMENLLTGTITTDMVTCLTGGAIEDFPLFFVSMQLGDYLDSVFNTYYDSGIYAPSYDEFAGNNWSLQWEAEYLTEEAVCFREIVKDASLCINRSSPILLRFETQGAYEPVTVPAGTFQQALMVTFSFRMATTVTFPGLATSAPMTVETTQWYVPFLGLVRSQVESATFEIMPGQPSSAPVESVIELLEYTVAP